MMSLDVKRRVVGILAVLFIGTLLIVAVLEGMHVG